RDAGVAAVGAAGRPAHQLDVGEALVAGELQHLLQRQVAQDGADETELHGASLKEMNHRGTEAQRRKDHLVGRQKGLRGPTLAFWLLCASVPLWFVWSFTPSPSGVRGSFAGSPRTAAPRAGRRRTSGTAAAPTGRRPQYSHKRIGIAA